MALLIAGCAALPQAKKEEAAPPVAIDGSLERLTKEKESLLAVVRALKPEAFTEVGLYRINPGDTAAKIARKHGLRIDELMVLNPGVDWTRLKVWQVVRVKAQEEAIQ